MGKMQLYYGDKGSKKATMSQEKRQKQRSVARAALVCKPEAVDGRTRAQRKNARREMDARRNEEMGYRRPPPRKRDRD